MQLTKQVTRKKTTHKSAITQKTIKPPRKVQIQPPSIILTNIRKSDKPALIEITGKEHIMKFIGPGKTWTLADVDKYINYTRQDALIPTNKRMWFSYAIRETNTSSVKPRPEHIRTSLPKSPLHSYPTPLILNPYPSGVSDNLRRNGNLIGIIEFKSISIYHILPFNLRQKYKNDVALTIYINDTHQGKGIARMAIEQLKIKIRKLKPHARKLISLVKSTNHAMQRAMEKLGFINTGLIGDGKPTLIVYTTNIKTPT